MLRITSHLFITVFAVMMIIFATNVAFAQTNPGKAKPGAKIKMYLPKAGEVFSPGDKVQIVWDVTLPASIDLSWCEQEILLSIDGGKTFPYRLTTELSPESRSFQWTVPNLPTDQAVLDIRFGSELSTMRFEKSKPQKSSMFRIRQSPKAIEEVKLNTPSLSRALPGDLIAIDWSSSVTDLDYFELLISFDQGAHFSAIERTNQVNSQWIVPTDFSGLVTFKVIAHKSNGENVESNVDTQPIIISRGQQ